MAAQPIALALEALFLEPGIQGRKALKARKRDQEVAPDIADQPLDLALVVALAGATKPVLEQIMRLQLTEDPRALTPPVAQDPGHRDLGVVIQNGDWNAAEEGKGRDMTVAECLRRLPGIGFDEAGIAVRQVHGEEVHLARDATDHRFRLAKVHLGVTGGMGKRHKHFL